MSATALPAPRPASDLEVEAERRHLEPSYERRQWLYGWQWVCRLERRGRVGLWDEARTGIVQARGTGATQGGALADALRRYQAILHSRATAPVRCGRCDGEGGVGPFQATTCGVCNGSGECPPVCSECHGELIDVEEDGDLLVCGPCFAGVLS